MADYGLPSVGIPNNPQSMESSVPGQPQQVPQASPVHVPTQQEPQYDEDSLLKILDARSSSKVKDQAFARGSTPDQFSGVDAVGTPGQLAQASIGRNVNERLQIWSKMVGDKNAVIGPDNDIWIKKEDNKFHPADHGHTSFLQDFAKKTGAGIDLTGQAVGELALASAGTLAGPYGTAIGAITGLAAGPSIGSYGRQFLMDKVYGITPDKEQLKRDMLIGGSLNLILGGVFGLAGKATDKIEQSIATGPKERAIKLARAQDGAQQFMETVGAMPSKFGEEGVEAPMYEAGQQVYGAVSKKRQDFSDAIASAKQKIIAAAGEQKPNTQGLADQTKDFLIKSGVRFDEHGMPQPFREVPINAQQIGGEVGPQIASVNEATLRSPLGAEGGESVINQVSEDYKALRSGEMGAKDFMDKISQWQDKASFKNFDPRSDKLRRSWAQLQNAGVNERNNFVQGLFQADPEALSSINKAYQDFRSTKDSIDMVMDAFGDKAAYEKGAKSLLNSDNNEVLMGLKNLTADHPEVFKNLRGSWLSEKMSNYVNNDGIFDAPSFFKSLKGESRKSMQIMFNPEELGKLQRSAKIMGSIKTSDLTSLEQGQSIADAVGDQIKLGVKFDISQPGTWLNFIKSKPTLASYLGNEGLPELAKRSSIEDATNINEAARALKNWALARRLPTDSSTISKAVINAIPNPRGMAQMQLRSNPALAGGMQGIGKMTGTDLVPPTQPQGETGSEAGALNQVGQ